MGFSLNKIGRLVAVGGSFYHHVHTVKTTRGGPARTSAVAVHSTAAFDFCPECERERSALRYLHTTVALLLGFWLQCGNFSRRGANNGDERQQKDLQSTEERQCDGQNFSPISWLFLS